MIVPLERVACAPRLCGQAGRRVGTTSATEKGGRVERSTETEIVWHREAVADLDRLSQPTKDAFAYMLDLIASRKLRPKEDRKLQPEGRPRQHIKKFSFAHHPMYHIRKGALIDGPYSASFSWEGSRLFVFALREKSAGDARKTLVRRANEVIDLADAISAAERPEATEATRATVRELTERYIGEPPQLPSRQEIRARYLPQMSRPANQPDGELRIPPAPGHKFSQSKTAGPTPRSRNDKQRDHRGHQGGPSKGPRR